jgi:hypothetical protein
MKEVSIEGRAENRGLILLLCSTSLAIRLNGEYERNMARSISGFSVPCWRPMAKATCLCNRGQWWADWAAWADSY